MRRPVRHWLVRQLSSHSAQYSFNSRYQLPYWGQYEFSRIQERADEWIWMTDHTLQYGVTKCLAIRGIREQQYQQLIRPLQHRDKQTRTLIPVDQSTGEIVQGQLDELARQVGVLLGIVSDLGSDTRKGMRLFQASGQAWRAGRLPKFGTSEVFPCVRTWVPTPHVLANVATLAAACPESPE